MVGGARARVGVNAEELCAAFRARPTKKAESLGTRLREEERARLLLAREALLEALDPSSGVDETLLAGIKRVREGRDVYMDHVVLHAVDGPLLGRLHRAARDDLVLAVDEDGRHVFGMGIWFHEKSLTKG